MRPSLKFILCSLLFIVVAACEKEPADNPVVVSRSLWNYDPLWIFTDVTCTKLRPEINSVSLDTVSQRFYKKMAVEMLNGTYNSEFRVQHYSAYPNPNNERTTQGNSFAYSLLDNPTGISLSSTDSLIAFVGPMNGQTIKLRVQNLDKPGGDGFGGKDYELKEGMNFIPIPGSGLVYVIYQTKEYRSAPAVQINIASGSVNGYFDISKHTPSQWNQLLSRATNKYFDLVGKYTHCTFPVEDFKKYTPDGTVLISIFDRFAFLEHEIMGIHKYNRPFGNRQYLHVMYHSYMYATAYHTGYVNSTMSTLCNVEKLQKDIWGPAHELGHQNQHKGFTWAGMTEVSNNVFSMYVQQQTGNKSRLQTEKLGSYNNRYEKAYSLAFPDTTAHCNLGDVFCKLVPFWQLQLYMSDALGNEDFYKDVHELLRTSTTPDSHGMRQLNFVDICCRAAKMNLIPFFERWGMLKPVDTVIDDYGKKTMTITEWDVKSMKSHILEYGYPLPSVSIEYICEENIQEYQTPTPVEKGNASLSGKTISANGFIHAVAYELFRDGKLIFASNASTFKVPDSVTLSGKLELFGIGADGSRAGGEL